jgi:hypothetical protein
LIVPASSVTGQDGNRAELDEDIAELERHLAKLALLHERAGQAVAEVAAVGRELEEVRTELVWVLARIGSPCCGATHWTQSAASPQESAETR